jgi:hypothetical protein
VLVCAGLLDTVGLETGSILPAGNTCRSFRVPDYYPHQARCGSIVVNRRRRVISSGGPFLAEDDSFNGPLSLIVVALSARDIVLEVANNGRHRQPFFKDDQHVRSLPCRVVGKQSNQMLSMDTSDGSINGSDPTSNFASRSSPYSLPAKANMMRHKQQGLLRGKQGQSCGRTRTPPSTTTTSCPVGMSEWW